jgi:subtilisin family serine protease
MLIDAVYAAGDLGVDVLNMSFSTGDDSVTLRKAIADVQASGVAVVASAGNDASDAGNSFPLRFPL